MKKPNAKSKQFEFKKHHIVFSIIGTILIAAIGAIIINVLFTIGRNGNGFHTEWQGADALMFFATILEALGTISLGAISIWQNMQLQKTNDEAQTRLETISNQANEVSIISKIIDHEERRLTNLEIACEKYIDFCSTFTIEESTKIFASGIKERHDTIKQKIHNNTSLYQNVTRELSWQTVEDISLKKCVSVLYFQALKTFQLLENKELPSQEILNVMTECWRFTDLYKKYIMVYRTKLDKVLFNELTLNEIRELYNRIEEESEDGQTENAQ